MGTLHGYTHAAITFDVLVWLTRHLPTNAFQTCNNIHCVSVVHVGTKLLAIGPGIPCTQWMLLACLVSPGWKLELGLVYFTHSQYGHFHIYITFTTHRNMHTHHTHTHTHAHTHTHTCSVLYLPSPILPPQSGEKAMRLRTDLVVSKHWSHVGSEPSVTCGTCTTSLHWPALLDALVPLLVSFLEEGPLTDV